MELLYILQPSRGLVPPRVLGRSHLFPSRRDDYELKHLVQCFQQGTICRAMIRIRIRVRARAGFLGNEDWRMCF